MVRVSITLWRNGEEVANVRDVVLPALRRKPVERTQHLDEDDAHDVGRRSYGALSFGALMNIADGSDQLLGSFEDAALDEWLIELADGETWSFLGAIIDIVPNGMAVDGVMEWTVVVQPMTGIDQFQALILLETGGFILQENGGRFKLEQQGS